MRAIILALVGVTLLAVLGISGYILYEGQRFLTTPPETPGREVHVVIPKGATFDQVAALLAEQGLVTDPRYFNLLGKYRNALGSIQAGEFALHTGWTPDRLLDHLVKGKPILHRLALREGLTWWQTADVVEQTGYASADQYAELVHDQELLERFNIPFSSAEGFLFPETYLLSRAETLDARFIVELQLKTFWKNAEKLWPEGLPDAETLRRTVILASLVEKETGLAQERARIAGVFAKRLARGMLLQCDPTVIYGLGRAFDGNLTRKHLNDASNPYNTYQHAGLPPGPICSPGYDALHAALHPEEHDYLFFVAKGDDSGAHVFSKTYRQHVNAVNKYQR